MFFKGVNVEDYNYKDIDMLVGRNVEPLSLLLTLSQVRYRHHKWVEVNLR
jgi:hypothetical protein